MTELTPERRREIRAHVKAGSLLSVWPHEILALLDALEAAEDRIAVLEAEIRMRVAHDAP